MAKKAGTGLGISIFLVIALLVILTAASALVATVIGSRAARDGVADELRRVHAAQALLQLKRYRELELASRLLRSEEQLMQRLADASAGTSDATELRTRLEEFREEHGIDLVIFFDPEGQVVLRSGSVEQPAMGDDLSGDPLFAAAAEKKNAAGLWPLGDTIYHAVVAQMVRNFDLLGYVGVAASIAPTAEEIKRATGAEVVLFYDSDTGPTPIASTLGDGRAEAVITDLRGRGQALARVKRGDTVPASDLELDQKPWLAFLTPLENAAEQPVGATVGLVEVEGRMAIYRQMQLLLAAVAGGALLVGLLVSFLMGRRVLAPVNRLAAALGAVRSGKYDAELPPAKGNFAALIRPIALLARQLGDKESLQQYLDRSVRELPEPAAREALVAPAARSLALLAIEMRRFANPKLGYDPEEHVGRLARDLRRISDTVAARQGSVEAVYGHRILAVFEGETAAFQSLAAAVEVLLILTTRENAFDEPVPPVIGLTQGSVVTGSVRWGERIDRAVAGLPVQQLESLLREATPGDIYMAKPLAEAIYPALQKAGLQIQAQRGLVSPMPLYKLTVEVAQQLTGVQAPPADPRRTAQALTLSDLVPGEVLGSRFEILAQLGSGPSGTAFKVRDRDRGDLVKLKILKNEMLADAAWTERLKENLELARMITHANVLGVHDFGQADGLGYIATDFVKGTTLRFFVSENKPMPLTPAFLLARRILEGMWAAHRQKLVHGGLKPENVLVEAHGGVRVMDFGMGPPIDATRREAPSSAAPYLAPEQIDGQPPAPHSDVFAWGVLFYELVTGRLPSAGATPSEVAKRRQQEAIELPSLHCAEMPSGLESLVMRCLAPNPGERFAGVKELAAGLDALRA